MGEEEIGDFFYDEHGPHLKTHIYETLYIREGDLSTSVSQLMVKAGHTHSGCPYLLCR